MKYYTIKAVIATDGTETRDMRSFDSYDEALTRFHSDMSSNIGNCKSILCMLINSVGGVYKNETWTATSAESTVTE